MMKKILSVAGLIGVAVMISCQSEQEAVSKSDVSKDALDKIHALGFSNSNVQRDEEGNYLVEGDIMLSPADLNRKADRQTLRIADVEQYHTTNLVTGAPRVIKVSVATTLGTAYVTATDAAIARYNAESLGLTFQRVSSGADIQIVKAGFLEQFQFLASAGFPSGGQPFNKIKVSTYQLNGQPQQTITSVIAHEMGHCIGFRHTDYMDRSYSCGGTPTNEGASTVGAIQIPGTPSGPDVGSWMLSCIGSGQDRPFNANDKVALNYLY